MGFGREKTGYRHIYGDYAEDNTIGGVGGFQFFFREGKFNAKTQGRKGRRPENQKTRRPENEKTRKRKFPIAPSPLTGRRCF